MKLLCTLAILWTLFTAAKALDCQTCLDTTDPLCSTEVPVTCATETMCIRATTEVNLGGIPVTVISKRCASPSICPSSGIQTLTINVGLSTALTSAECCDTDNCNSVTLPAPTRNTTISGLECNFCLPNLNMCNIIVGCEGNEDRCFQGMVTGGPIGDPILGCASASLCATGLGSELLQNFGTVTAAPTCCSTMFCNELADSSTTVATTRPQTTSVTTVGSGGDGLSSGVTTGSGGDGLSSGVTTGSGGDGLSSGVTTGSGGDGLSSGVTTGSSGDGLSSGVTNGSGGDGLSSGVTNGSGGDGVSSGVTNGSGGDGVSSGVTNGSGGDGVSSGVTNGSGGDGVSGDVTNGSGGDGESGDVTNGSGGDGESGGVTNGSDGDGGAGGTTTNSSPIISCALTGPVGFIIMIFNFWLIFIQ